MARDPTLGTALEDIESSVTTLDGVDGTLRGRSPGSPTERRVRRIARRAVRGILTLGPLGRLRRWQAALLVLTLFLTSGAVAVYFGPATLGSTPPLQTAFLFDREGRPLGQIRAEENRVVVPLDRIPEVVRNAFVAAEDERFWGHPGVDPIAIGRALLANARGDREGASTITQQLVKNQVVAGDRSLWRKLREAVTAIRIDRRYSKEEILEAYLNSIYLGHGAYGVEAAARLYFERSIEDVTLAQAAMLAGITAAPHRFSPRLNPIFARQRRSFVLTRMFLRGYITDGQRFQASVEKLEIAKPKTLPAVSPLFVDWVRGEILRELGEDVLYRGGLRVTTTLDLDIQRAAEEAVAGVLDRPGDPEAAVVAIEIATGEVRAMVGGRSPRPGDFNLATRARRQAGSAFKPFVLAAALEQGMELTKTYRAPGFLRLRFPSGEVWKVGNFDRRGYGRLSLRSATAHSVNTVYAQLIRDVGPERVVEIAKRLGITSRLSAVPSLALGTSGVTPLEMGGAFAAFANDGVYLRPTGLARVEDAAGSVLRGGERKGRDAIPADVATGVREALQAAVRQGTGYTARIPGITAGGKTGTTEDYRDAWFVGFASGFAVAVWVGYPSGGKTMERVHGIRVTGNSFPARIWKRLMVALLGKYRPGEYEEAPPARSRRSPPRPEPEASPEPQPEPSPEPPEEPNPLPLPTLIPRTPAPG